MGKKPEQDRSSNVANVGSMVNSAFQQASPGASQYLTIASPEVKSDAGELVTEILEAIDGIGLDEQQMSDVRAEAETIQAQMKLEKPKSLVIKACLEAIKGILMGIVMTEGKALGASIVEKINEVLDRL